VKVRGVVPTNVSAARGWDGPATGASVGGGGGRGAEEKVMEADGDLDVANESLSIAHRRAAAVKRR
jgi:hypothetical protein